MIMTRVNQVVLPLCLAKQFKKVRTTSSAK